VAGDDIVEEVGFNTKDLFITIDCFKIYSLQESPDACAECASVIIQSSTEVNDLVIITVKDTSEAETYS